MIVQRFDVPNELADYKFDQNRLYAFFEDQGIKISVLVDQIDKLKKGNLYYSSIEALYNGEEFPVGVYNENKIFVEVHAFTRAFKILEKELKK